MPFSEISAKEPGCLKYVLMEVIAEPGRFLTYERWTNKAALDAHMVTKDIKEIVPKLEPILAKPVSQIFLDGRDRRVSRNPVSRIGQRLAMRGARSNG